MIKRLIDIVLFTSLFISLGAGALVYRTYAVLDKDPDWRLISFVFMSTLFIYNLTKLIPLWNERMTENYAYNRRHKWNIRNRKLLFVVTIISALISMNLFVYLNSITQIFLVQLGVISVLYTMPTFSGTPLRAMPLLKIFLIAYVWAGTTILPIIEFSQPAILLFSESFFFILAITIPFDIRDFKRDRHEGIITIPNKIGQKRAKFISVFFLLVSSVFGYYVIGNSLTGYINILLNITFIPILMTSNEKRGEYFYLGVIDGLLILRLLAFIR